MSFHSRTKKLDGMWDIPHSPGMQSNEIVFSFRRKVLISIRTRQWVCRWFSPRKETRLPVSTVSGLRIAYTVLESFGSHRFDEIDGDDIQLGPLTPGYGRGKGRGKGKGVCMYTLHIYASLPISCGEETYFDRMPGYLCKLLGFNFFLASIAYVVTSYNNWSLTTYSLIIESSTVRIEAKI